MQSRSRTTELNKTFTFPVFSSGHFKGDLSGRGTQWQFLRSQIALKQLLGKRKKTKYLLHLRALCSDFPVLSNCFTLRGLSSDWELLRFNAKFQKDLSRCLLHLCFLFSLWFGSTQTHKPKKSGWADSLDFALERLQTFFIHSSPPWRHS